MLRRFLSGYQIRQLREYLTAYLMIAPATILIFTFGIFPVGFALYVSLHKWRIKQGEYRGLINYIKAIDNLAYILLFALALGAFFGGYVLLRRVAKRIREGVAEQKTWWFVIPGAVYAATILVFVRWTVLLFPEVLGIANKIWGIEKTRELFIRLLSEAFHVPNVYSGWLLFLYLMLASVVISVLFLRYSRIRHHLDQVSDLMLTWIAATVGVVLVWFTYNEIVKAYQAAFEAGTDPGILPQMITLSTGAILLIAAWKLWQGASQSASGWRFWGRLLASFGLMVGAWLLIGELPIVLASGDKDLWTGLKVTIFYSLGTVPFQLAFALVLSVLLFQEFWGSEFFRILYFLPYVTPTVASAAVFRQLFSNRYQAPLNQLLLGLGFDPLQWIREPKGVFFMLGESMGLTIPDWAAGPSLALVVIMIYSIWTYVGYDTVIYLAGLGNISAELVEAAEIDGAGKWQVFRYITFPLLSPTTYFLSLMAIIGTFKAFGHIWVMRQQEALGTVDTFSVVIFTEFFEKLRYGYASALAFVLFAIILSLTYINNKVQGSRVFYG